VEDLLRDMEKGHDVAVHGLGRYCLNAGPRLCRAGRGCTKRRMRRLVALLILAAAGAAPAAGRDESWHLVPGSFEPGRGPDGNSVFLDAPDGLILVDTGRHPAHQEKLLAYAKARGKPIAAIVNTHWHLDHSGGNAEIRAAFPSAEVYASNAVEGALTGFFPASRKSAEEFLASGKAGPELTAEIKRDFAAMDDVASLRATRPVTGSGAVRIAGRGLAVNLARFAATEGDVWIYDPRAKLLIAGDLVVGPVPFFDTGCPEGWREALTKIAATPFVTLIPGHGAPMTRPQFLQWRTAFGNLLDCAVSDRDKAACIDGWKRDAAAFIPAGDRRIDGMVGYYLDTRLRAPYADREKYCTPLR
jgi:glyoxylase-like metal-dependent hydrolase (beta-lactamase superfamily II)